MKYRQYPGNFNLNKLLILKSKLIFNQLVDELIMMDRQFLSPFGYQVMATVELTHDQINKFVLEHTAHP